MAGRSLSSHLPQKRRHLAGTECECRHICAHGTPCCLNGAWPHTLHVCHDPHCPCHAQRRYVEAKHLEAIHD